MKVPVIYNRYRSDSTPQTDVKRFVKNEWSGSTQTVKDDISILSVRPAVSRQCYDTVTKSFKRRSASGEIFNFDFQSTKSTFASGGSYVNTASTSYPAPTVNTARDWRAENGYVHAALYQNLAVPVVALDTTSSLQRAQINALGNVNKTDFDAATFMGEWSKTKSLHRDLCNALLKIALEGESARVKRSTFDKTPVYDDRGNPLLNKKGEPKFKYVHTKGGMRGDGKLKHAKNFSDLYLAARYGLLPLLHDLEDAWKFMNRKYPPRNTARAFDVVQGTSSTKSRWNVGHGYFDNDVVTVRTVVTRVGILYDTDPASRALAGLGLTRPLSTAWELIPWSFVADWIVDVGSWLDAMQPAGFTRTLCAWVSTLETIVLTTTSGPFVRTVTDPVDTTSSYSLNDWSIRTETTKSRYAWSPSLPKLPALGSGFNTIRSVDLAALVLQKTRTKIT